METPSPYRGLSETQVETPNQGNDALTNVNTDVQETLGDANLRPRIVESSQISNEIQAWTGNFEKKNNDRTMRVRKEMEKKLDAILEEIKSSKSASTVTNRRFETNDTQYMQPSGSKIDKSMEVRASYNEYSDSEDDDYPLQASKMKNLRHPAEPLHRSGINLDETLVSKEDSGRGLSQ